jgi:O-antigen/teichoic acid export membrane protein
VSPSPEQTPGRERAREIASGALLQQATQVLGLVGLLLTITLLARRVSVAELGAYGLIASLTGYLMILRNSVASSTVKALAAARDDSERAAGFSTAVVGYLIAGLVTAVLLAAVAVVVAAVVLDGELRESAQVGGVILGAVVGIAIAVGVYLDALRGSLLLRRSAAVELVAVSVFVVVMVAAVLLDAPLEVLIPLNGTVTLLSGLIAAGQVRILRLPYRFRRAAVSREWADRIVPTAGSLLVIELANLVIYGLDRIVLGAYKSATAVGLYEGPVRAHNAFYAINGALGVTLVPAASRERADAQAGRPDELLVRGSRYTLALIVPLAVTSMVMAGPLLGVWLGDRYEDGGTALTLLVGYWVLHGALAVMPAFLVGVGRAAEVARIYVGIALLNLAITVALTPELGVEGPALGTLIAFVAAFPLLLRLSLRSVGVPLRRFARDVWLPAYTLAALLAAGLGALRIGADPDSLGPVLAATIAGPVVYWIAFWTFFLHPDERRLAGQVARGLVGR